MSNLDLLGFIHGDDKRLSGTDHNMSHNLLVSKEQLPALRLLLVCGRLLFTLFHCLAYLSKVEESDLPKLVGKHKSFHFSSPNGCFQITQTGDLLAILELMEKSAL